MYYSHDGGETYKDVSQLSTPPGSGGYWGHPIAEAALKDSTPVPWLSFNWNSLWGGLRRSLSNCWLNKVWLVDVVRSHLPMGLRPRHVWDGSDYLGH